MSARILSQDEADITGIDLVELLRRLHRAGWEGNASLKRLRAVVPGMAYGAPPDEEIRNHIEHAALWSPPCQLVARVDYLSAVAIKGQFSPTLWRGWRLFDRDAGAGAAARVLDTFPPVKP